MKSYESYTSEDFIQDEFFLKWVKENNSEAAVFWKKWINSHPNKKEEIEVAKYAINNIRYKSHYTLNDAEYTQVFEKVLRSENNSTKSFILKPYNALKYAAALIPLLIATYFIYTNFFESSDSENLATKIDYEERYYPNGRKASLRLEDNTQININANSRIRFPKNFNSLPKREVFLEGEAFFDVKRDTLKPFKVYTGNLITEVLGTSFNIGADPSENEIQVTVAQGLVAVSDVSGNRIVLNPNEYVIYNKKDQTFSKGSTKNLDKIIGWKSGKLVFEREPIQKVFKELERWYGVEFIKEESISGFYTGSFLNDPLDKVLLGISYTSNFTYEIQGKSVIIKKK